MRIGTEFTKVRPIGRQYQRFYQLDETMELLHWQPSSKKPEKAIRKRLYILFCMDMHTYMCAHANAIYIYIYIYICELFYIQHHIVEMILICELFYIQHHIVEM